MKAKGLNMGFVPVMLKKVRNSMRPADTDVIPEFRDYKSVLLANPLKCEMSIRRKLCRW